MKWEGNRQSEHVQDRRGMSAGVRTVGAGTLVLALLGSVVFGVDPQLIMGLLGGLEAAPTQQQSAAPAQNDRMTRFVSTVLADTEDVWGDLFRAGAAQYAPPGLVLYSGATPTACGTGQSAMGPFYCPGDQKVYLDTDFFDTLTRDLGAGGEFAQAYVIAHEVGHHVQQLMGISEQVRALQNRASERDANALSVRLELQADCFAGVWAHHAQRSRQILETGDVEKAMNAAAKIGDDALQQRSRGYAVPDSFTHGSSAQRVRWFGTGLQNGSVRACDTFNAHTL